jgi:hypothetical protein
VKDRYGLTLVNAAIVNAEVLQIIAFGLFCAESKLVIATLALASTIYQIFESHLLILNPSLRQYCLRRDRVIADEVSCQAELACVVALQQTYTVSLRKVKAAAATAAVHQSRYMCHIVTVFDKLSQSGARCCRR